MYRFPYNGLPRIHDPWHHSFPGLLVDAERRDATAAFPRAASQGPHYSTVGLPRRGASWRLVTWECLIHLFSRAPRRHRGSISHRHSFPTLSTYLGHIFLTRIWNASEHFPNSMNRSASFKVGRLEWALQKFKKCWNILNFNLVFGL